MLFDVDQLYNWTIFRFPKEDRNTIQISTVSCIISFKKLTVYGEHVSLHHVLVPESVARVITSMFQLHICQIETAVVENANLQSVRLRFLNSLISIFV